MHQIRRIIELQQQGCGIRQTVRLTGLSRNTIREYLRRLSCAGLSLPEAMKLDDASLSAVVYTDALEKTTAGRTVDDRYSVLAEKLDNYCKELSKRGVTRQLLWEEYRKEHPDGYGYTQFCEYLNHQIRVDDAVMHFVHRLIEVPFRVPVEMKGLKLLPWGGFLLKVHDPLSPPSPAEALAKAGFAIACRGAEREMISWAGGLRRTQSALSGGLKDNFRRPP
jgi:hypothetical protein